MNSDFDGYTAPNAHPWFVSATPEATPTITVNDSTDNGATITLSNYNEGGWYYIAESETSGGGAPGSGVGGAWVGGGAQGGGANGANGGSDCVGPIGGSQTEITGLDPNTNYTITAYTGECGGAEIASGAFGTAQAASTVTLTATNITSTSFTLNISGHTTAWHYKYTRTPARGVIRSRLLYLCNGWYFHGERDRAYGGKRTIP